MTNDIKSKYKELLSNYNMAAILVAELLRQNIIKVKNVKQQSIITASVASILRSAREHEQFNLHDDTGMYEVVEAYLAELELRGNEWVYSSLKDLFLAEKKRIEDYWREERESYE